MPKKAFNIMFTDKMLEELQKEAEIQKISVSALIRQACRFYLAMIKKAPQIRDQYGDP